MRTLIAVIGLEVYAFALAAVQSVNGVRTDEAKYLLNIPYPHPPLVRWFFSLFDGFSWQESAVRFLLATLMVQAVWLVWDMGRALPRPARVLLTTLWLGSMAFLLQAGTVMMAPITALEALTFLWLLSRPPEGLPGSATIGFLWLVTVFSALQGVLLAPLAIAVLRLRGTPLRARIWYIGAPLVLLALYILGNPLILASFGLQAGKDAGDTLLTRTAGLFWILILAGSGIGSVLGITGLLLKKHLWILASFLLLLGYVFLGRFDYYAILFLPFLITGSKHLLRRMPQIAAFVLGGLLLCTVLLVLQVPLFSPRSPAQAVLQRAGTGLILVQGPMGHEWQYEASAGQVVERFTAARVPDAALVVCIDPCTDAAAQRP